MTVDTEHDPRRATGHFFQKDLPKYRVTSRYDDAVGRRREKLVSSHIAIIVDHVIDVGTAIVRQIESAIGVSHSFQKLHIAWRERLAHELLECVNLPST